MRKALLGIACIGLVGCATDYTSGGNVVNRDTPTQGYDVTIVREYVTFADVIPGIPTDHRFRWVATNSSSEPRCVRVTLEGLIGPGGRDSGRVYLLPPKSGPQVVAYRQSAYGEAINAGTSEETIWIPTGSNCGHPPQ